MQAGYERSRLAEVLEHIRANDQVILAELRDLFLIQIEIDEACVFERWHQPVLIIGEGDVAAPFHQRGSKYSVAATKVEHFGSRSNRSAPTLNPGDGIFRLVNIERLIIPVLEMVGYELVNDHAAPPDETGTSAPFFNSTLRPMRAARSSACV